MATTAKGLWYPAGTDIINPLHPVLAAMQTSVGDNSGFYTPSGIHTIADSSGRTPLVNNLISAGYTPSQNNPVFVFQSDVGLLYRYNGSNWYVIYNARDPHLTTENLNDLNQTGTFFQTLNANSTLARNYPVALAGLLEVFRHPTGGAFIYQRYTVYSGASSPGNGVQYQNSVWTRGSMNSGTAWSAWTGPADTSWTAVGTLQNSYTAASPSPAYQIRGSVVHLSGQMYRTTAPNYETAFTLPVSLRGVITVVNRSHTAPDTIQINPSGAVQVFSSSARTTATGYMLDGISFPII